VLSQKLAREIVSRIQKLRKKSGLQVGESVEDDTFDAVAGAAIAANAALVADAVRCMPLPASRMPGHAVPLGQERFSACAEEKDGATNQEPDFSVFLTRPCLSFDQVILYLEKRISCAKLCDCEMIFLSGACDCLACGGYRFAVLFFVVSLVLMQ
ncbi:unnamed protein product, partial [Laminaria digitata]